MAIPLIQEGNFALFCSCDISKGKSRDNTKDSRANI